MEATKIVSCSQICTDGSCTYQIPADVRTDEDCDHTWKSEKWETLAHGRKNLTVPDCRKVVYFVTRCDSGDKRFDHHVTYRVTVTTPGPNTTVPPIVNVTTPDGVTPSDTVTTSDPNTTMISLGIWLPVLIVLLFLVGLCIGLFIMYRLKMFCFKRANGPNSADGICDLRDGEDGISGASVPLNNNHTPPGPNRNGVMTGGENIPMLPISNGGSYLLNNDDPPPA